MSKEQLIVALDTSSINEASCIVKCLDGKLTFYKIGLELIMNGGICFAKELAASNYNVFLDIKLLDIENTVERAVSNIADTGIRFLSIHGLDTKTVHAAMRGAVGSKLKILSVTLLTNKTRHDLLEQGFMDKTEQELVVHRSNIARLAGCHGVICSGKEAKAIREASSSNFIIVTPGIRLIDNKSHDQKRVTTPKQALSDGSNYLVVGRPITHAKDKKAEAEKFLRLIETYQI